MRYPSLLQKKIHSHVIQTQKKHTAKEQKQYDKRSIYFFFTVFILVLVGVIGYFGQLIATYSLNLPSTSTPFERKLPESSLIYDSKGNILYSIYSTQNRIYVPLQSIPQTMRLAMLAAEDINFYKEEGINLQAIARSALHDIFNYSGETSLQGASTITQQLVKYTALNLNRTTERKIKEVILTLRVSQKYSKDQILEAYLNTVPFGGSNYGIEVAARQYFGEDVSQLDLAQSAFLAGLPQAPSIYAPTYDTKTNTFTVPLGAIDRQEYVLDQMLKNKDITGVTNDDISIAKAEVLHFKSIDIKYQSFDQYIKGLLYTMYGDGVYTDGYKVYTTLDPNLQDLAQQKVTLGVAKQTAQGLGVHNGSLVAIDATNGNTLAMIGSVDYNNTSPKVAGNINMALSPVSPGSSVKPFVYLGGFETGMNPDTKLQDVKTTFQGNYTPMDFDNKFENDISLKDALLQSRNIPAVEVAQKIGLQHVYSNLVRAGLPLGSIYNYGLSLAIGGCEIPLIDHTGAFAVLSQDGVKHPIRSILLVKNKYGKTVEDNTKVQSSTIFDPNLVKEMNSILKNYHTLQVGDKSSKNVINGVTYEVAGKTGTGQDNKNNLFMGYSGHLSVGVWVGNTDQSFTNNNTFGEDTAAPIWNAFMHEALPEFSANNGF